MRQRGMTTEQNAAPVEVDDQKHQKKKKKKTKKTTTTTTTTTTQNAYSDDEGNVVIEVVSVILTYLPRLKFVGDRHLDVMTVIRWS